MDKEILEVGKINQFDSVLSFVSYANTHYVPLIKKLAEDGRLEDASRHLLGFLYDDFRSLLNELEKHTTIKKGVR